MHPSSYNSFACKQGLRRVSLAYWWCVYKRKETTTTIMIMIVLCLGRPGCVCTESRQSKANTNAHILYTACAVVVCKPFFVRAFSSSFCTVFSPVSFPIPPEMIMIGRRKWGMSMLSRREEIFSAHVKPVLFHSLLSSDTHGVFSSCLSLLFLP